MRISNLNKEKTMEKMIDEELKGVTGGTIIPVIVKQGDTLEKYAKKLPWKISASGTTSKTRIRSMSARS